MMWTVDGRQDICHGNSTSCQQALTILLMPGLEVQGALPHLGVLSAGLEPAALQHRGSDEVRGAHGHVALADDLLERVVAERHLQAGCRLAQVHESAPALRSLVLLRGLSDLCLPLCCQVIGGRKSAHTGNAPAARGELLQMCCIQASGVCFSPTSRLMKKPLQAP